MICQFGKDFVANASCKLTFITRLKKAFTLKFNIIKPNTSLKIRYQLFYRYRNGFQKFLVDITDDYCDYMTGGNLKSKVLDLLKPGIEKYCNVILTCPYIGPFSIEKLPVDGEMFGNPFLPAGDYYLNISTFNTQLMFSGQFYFNIPAGKTIEDDSMGR